MNKQQFLAAFRAQCIGLPENDIEKSLDYYSEMIDDRIEDGLTEEEAVAAMGNIEDIIEQIMMDTPLTTMVKAKIKPARSLRIWEIILLILGSPIWLALLLAMAAVVLSLYILLWSVIIVLYAVNLALALISLGSIIGFIILLCMKRPIHAVLLLGAGFICGGISVLLFIGFNQVTRYFIKLSKKILYVIKSCFMGKGR